MKFEQRMILVIVLVFGLLLTLLFINTLTRIPDCPKTLSSEHYSCLEDTDCIYNPVYECINRERDFYCIADPELIELRQKISQHFICLCQERKCKTTFIR